MIPFSAHCNMSLGAQLADILLPAREVKGLLGIRAVLAMHLSLETFRANIVRVRQPSRPLQENNRK